MKLFLYLLIFLLGSSAGWFANYLLPTDSKQTVHEKVADIIESPLEKYEFEMLSNNDIKPGKLTVKNILNKEDKYESYLFEFEFNPNLDEKNRKITTGQINFPKSENYDSGHKFPVILMFRGYINQETFKTGDGTRRAAGYFAENGFITVAPDFLGYGGSDKEASDIFETRFQTYVTALSLLNTLETLNQNKNLLSADANHHSLLTTHHPQLLTWGHSNGGQVAISTLEISRKSYPTSLWAPVTKPFPYSVLYYTDDSEDGGKFIRRKLSEFEELYDTDKFSLSNYLENINAPVQIQQGLADDAIPVDWTRDFVNKLRSSDKDIQLIEYPGTDHDMRPNWDNAVEKDLEFYKKYLDI